MGFPITLVQECNGLEDPGETIPHSANAFTVRFKPFQIRSFLLSF